MAGVGLFRAPPIGSEVLPRYTATSGSSAQSGLFVATLLTLPIPNLGLAKGAAYKQKASLAKPVVLLRKTTFCSLRNQASINLTIAPPLFLPP